ncbi:DUF4157 domain-containing protein [Aliiglaciecola sp. NS0011-25]|uniref:eCIS core domain-containing protein n=1 Tax=Aliiglaciecola sp. NS0011-25 TaxID=3127654 RepID=UPI00310C2D08
MSITSYPTSKANTKGSAETKSSKSVKVEPKLKTSKVNPTWQKLAYTNDTWSNDSHLPSAIKVGNPNSALEKEADAVAQSVLRQPSYSNKHASQVNSSTDRYPQVIRAKQRSNSSQPKITKQVENIVKNPDQGSPISEDIKHPVSRVLSNDLSQIRVHQNSASNRAAKDLNAKAFTLGNHIFLGSKQSSNDIGLMAHEITHTQQKSSTQQIQRTPEEDICEREPSMQSQSLPQSLNQTFEADGASLLSDQSVEQHSDDEICEPAENEFSFNPDDYNVEEMRNDTLNIESIRVEQWFARNGDVSLPETPAYQTFRRRLKAERTKRVEYGHLWMATATSATPEKLYMLKDNNGVALIISIYPESVIGTPNRSFPDPIMSEQQFQDHLSDIDIPIMSEAEYVARLRASEAALIREESDAIRLYSEENDNSLFGSPAPINYRNDDRIRPYSGGYSLTDPRASAIQQTLPYRNVNVRAGDIGEAFALSDRNKFLVGSNYNNAGRTWSGDPLRPFRATRGNVPVADVLVSSGSPFQDLSVKVTRPGTASYSSPSARTRFNTYLSGHKDILNTNAAKFQRFASTYRPNMTLSQVSDGLGLAIPENHLAEYRALLNNPTGSDLTNTGNVSQKPNWDLEPMKTIYKATRFDTPIDLNDSSPPLQNGAELYEARQNGRITPAQFDNLIQQIGQQAASRAVAIPNFNTNTIRWYESFLDTLPNRNPTDMRAGIDTNTAQAIEEMRRMQQSNLPDAQFSTGDWQQARRTTALRQAPRAAGLGVAIGVGADYLFNEQANLNDPAYRAHLIKLGLLEGGAGAASEVGEHYMRTRAGQMIITEGLEATSAKAVAARLGARAVPGVIDAVMETYNIATDGRENSATEIVVRTGRAAVIGGSSAWAGAAIGTAIGGPIGFGVGLLAGLAVGWLGNRLIGGGANYWNERARQRQIQEEQARRRRREQAIQERIMNELQRRQQRLDIPLASESSSVTGVEAIFGSHTDNPMFMESSPDNQPTVGDIEAEILRSYLIRDR